MLWSASGFLSVPLGVKDSLLALGALAAWFALDRTWQGFLEGMLTAIAGTFVEIVLVRNGVFSYLPPNDSILGVASWLPWLYFCASVALGNIARALENETIKRNPRFSTTVKRNHLNWVTKENC